MPIFLVHRWGMLCNQLTTVHGRSYRVSICLGYLFHIFDLTLVEYRRIRQPLFYQSYQQNKS